MSKFNFNVNTDTVPATEDEIFFRIETVEDVDGYEIDGAALFYVSDGAPVTRLSANGIWPLDHDGQEGIKSAQYERPNGLVITIEDAKKLGIPAE